MNAFLIHRKKKNTTQQQHQNNAYEFVCPKPAKIVLLFNVFEKKDFINMEAEAERVIFRIGSCIL